MVRHSGGTACYVAENSVDGESHDRGGAELSAGAEKGCVNLNFEGCLQASCNSGYLRRVEVNSR